MLFSNDGGETADDQKPEGILKSMISKIEILDNVVALFNGNGFLLVYFMVFLFFVILAGTSCFFKIYRKDIFNMPLRLPTILGLGISYSVKQLNYATISLCLVLTFSVGIVITVSERDFRILTDQIQEARNRMVEIEDSIADKEDDILVSKIPQKESFIQTMGLQSESGQFSSMYPLDTKGLKERSLQCEVEKYDKRSQQYKPNENKLASQNIDSKDNFPKNDVCEFNNWDTIETANTNVRQITDNTRFVEEHNPESTFSTSSNPGTFFDVFVPDEYLTKVEKRKNNLMQTFESNISTSQFSSNDDGRFGLVFAAAHSNSPVITEDNHRSKSILSNSGNSRLDKVDDKGSKEPLKPILRPTYQVIDLSDGEESTQELNNVCLGLKSLLCGGRKRVPRHLRDFYHPRSGSAKEVRFVPQYYNPTNDSIYCKDVEHRQGINTS